MQKCLRRWFGIPLLCVFGGISVSGPAFADSEIEDQLAEIGAVPNEEIVVVQRKYTRKTNRVELTPVAIGGVPFGTVRRTLFGGASLTYHIADTWALELPNFVYTKTFFSGFMDSINQAQTNASLPEIAIEEQKLLFFITGGFQWTPFYGKFSTFSTFIAYIEPFFSAGAGLAKTESNSYFTFYPGVGLRLFFKEWFSMRFDFRDYIYTEVGTSGSTLRNNFAFTVSLSFWLPKMPY